MEPGRVRQRAEVVVGGNVVPSGGSRRQKAVTGVKQQGIIQQGARTTIEPCNFRLSKD